MATAQILELTDQDFDRQVRRPGPVLVDFWAPWCGPCKVVAPVLEELANEYLGRVTFAKVNVDEHGDLASRFEIRSIPTLVIFKDGKVVDQIIGAVPKDQVRKRLDRHLA